MRRPPTPEAEQGAALRVLRSDPTIRYASGGRRLLRMLDGPTGEWRQLLDTMPPHCTLLVAAAVRDCIHAWQTVAQHVEKRLI